MAIKRIIICDICGKEERLDICWRKQWFIENISHHICSKKCFEKSIKNKKELLNEN